VAPGRARPSRPRHRARRQRRFDAVLGLPAPDPGPLGSTGGFLSAETAPLLHNPPRPLLGPLRRLQRCSGRYASDITHFLGRKRLVGGSQPAERPELGFGGCMTPIWGWWAGAAGAARESRLATPLDQDRSLPGLGGGRRGQSPQVHPPNRRSLTRAHTSRARARVFYI